MPAILLRRGLASALASAPAADYEPLWTTDTHELYVWQGGVAHPVSGTIGATGPAGVASATAPLHLTGSTISIDDPLGLSHGGTGADLSAAAAGLLIKDTAGASALVTGPLPVGNPAYLTGILSLANGGLSANNTGGFAVGTIPIGIGGQVVTGPLNTSSTRKVLTETGTGTVGQDPVFSDWITSISGSATLGTSYTITADNAWQDTGLSLTLPSAGTYLVWFTARGALQISAGSSAFIMARLWDVTAGAAIANSERQCLLVASSAVGVHASCATTLIPVSVTGAHTIRLEGLRSGTGATWSTSGIFSDSNGRTAIGYLKLAET